MRDREAPTGGPFPSYEPSWNLHEVAHGPIGERNLFHSRNRFPSPMTNSSEWERELFLVTHDELICHAYVCRVFKPVCFYMLYRVK